MRLLCPHSEEVVVLPYSGVETQDYTRLCTKRGLQLRVSYNIDPVFFKFNNDDVKQVLRQAPQRGFDGGSDGAALQEGGAKRSARAKPVEFERRQLDADQAFGQGGLEGDRVQKQRQVD